MNFQLERRSGRIILRCEGSLDAATAPLLEAQLEPLFAEAAPPRITLDFYGVGYLASAGLRSLVNLAKRAAAGGGTLRLVNLHPTVERVIEITELMPVLTSFHARPIAEDTEEARTRFAGKVKDIQNIFPTPKSDPVHDAYFLFTLLRGVDRIDHMKTGKAFLGKRGVLDYETARRFRVPEQLASLESVVRETADCLEGHIIPGHPLTQQNVLPPPTIASIAGNLFACMLNPNTIWDAHCHKVAETEISAAAGVSELIGYDPELAGGIFTFGGTGTILYGVKIGLEKAVPGSMAKGLRQTVKVIAGDVSHYARLNVTGWLGIGTDNVVIVPTDEDNSMRLIEFEQAARKVLDAGDKLAAIIATTGTTDAFGIDNLEFIVGLRDRLVKEYGLSYSPHVHADAVIGWAYAVFNDYDFDANPLGLHPRALRCLWDTRSNIRHLHLADSLGIDFHKTGYTPYTSSLFLCKDHRDMTLLSRSPEMMPYLFQFGNYHPGEYTLETSRNGGSMLSALANLKQLGKEGYRILLGHAVGMAEYLRKRLEDETWSVVLNDYNYGPVTLFRIYPPGVDAHRTYHDELYNPEKADQLKHHNDYNRRIFQYMLAEMEAGRGPAVSLTDHYRDTPYGEAIVAIKSFVMSPFVDEAAMESVLRTAAEARQKVS